MSVSASESARAFVPQTSSAATSALGHRLPVLWGIVCWLVA